MSNQPMDAFSATVKSLGDHVVSYVGKSNLLSVMVIADRTDGVADISIVLKDQSWDAMSRAVDKMLEIRDMFLDEFAISYRFDAEAPSPDRAPTRSSEAVFCHS